MALTPIDEVHALQIQAGTLGRKAGHAFEDSICEYINALAFPLVGDLPAEGHVFSGNPGSLLLRYILRFLGYDDVQSVIALSTGALATSEDGRHWLSINGADVRRCKSDIVITLNRLDAPSVTVGVSTKQCNNPKPTNAQLYFTTARGFTKLLRDNGVPVSDLALTALRHFCGDPGFRPLDVPGATDGRLTDPRRFFWEEMTAGAREEWEAIFSDRQDDVTRLLLQKAYIDDPFVPDFLIHKTRLATSVDSTEVAIYDIGELITLSRQYQGYTTRPYSVRKGSYRDPIGVTHLAPRFGVVQMQRGGQEQHPDQLQFNLEAGYFYKI
ncbi:hypothetical protein [Caulobacter sp. NIBR2454]|uniref:hypothetical protein n=1 Tax=Caulobacter sp. NIBR2454 TaxID=3015996 RepID=UPI0022B6A85B|nr:hypothetical protein [Caulobacter sp. NIBR2454]